MLTDKKFLTGVVVGLGATYIFHRFVKPLPTNKAK